MRELAQRSWFSLCLVFGRMLRAGRYSKVRVAGDGDAREVHKHRRFYAPLLIRLGNVLVGILDTGVRVLPQHEWETNEREMYRSLYGLAVRGDGNELILPFLPGQSLATLLEDSQREDAVRNRAIGLAIIALTELHDRGISHGDAMAENVMIDLDVGVARWFDFETSHDLDRSITWRCADDVRALLATCVLRTRPAVLQIFTDTYQNEEVLRVAMTSFASPFQRPLIFHLGQAPLSFGDFQAVAAAAGS